MDKEPITVKGLENLKSELDDLKNVQRPKIDQKNGFKKDLSKLIKFGQTWVTILTKNGGL